ncbi:hypothetical protein [Halorubrum sp. AS12]|uniref:hypothetical protein n=1 Tax=Halorubrum sp. AS12 TaxID=3409687 RepID=UPI003DA7935B
MSLRSFSDPDTEFELLISEAGDRGDGHQVGEPYGIRCVYCGATIEIDGPDGHQTAIDDLPHATTCPQRDVVSQYYRDRFVR